MNNETDAWKHALRLHRDDVVEVLAGMQAEIDFLRKAIMESGGITSARLDKIRAASLLLKGKFQNDLSQRIGPPLV
jgi:hypothetical protein